MKNTMLIAYREFRVYLTSPMAYIVACIFLVLNGLLFTLYLERTAYDDTSIRGYTDPNNILGLFGNLALMLFAAVLAMRLIAEEKKLGTWELLLTAPVRDTEVVLGKFLGSLGMLVGMLVLTLYFPLLLWAFGDPDSGPIITSYLGLFLLGATSLSIGLFASSVTSNQIVAAVVAGGILAVLYFIGAAGDALSGPAGNIISYISLSSHFTSFVEGIIDTRAIIYYLSVTALFLFLTIRSVETGRWS